jgi:deoxyribose-phosphate aldolase
MTRFAPGTTLTPQNVADLIDHALLKPDLTPAEVRAGIEEVAAYDVWSVCVRPSDVPLAAEILTGRHTKVCTVIGFPHGTTSTAAKVAESNAAMDDGAVELDMVLNIGRLRGGDTDYVRDDIRAVVAAGHARDVLVKVIFETAMLTDEQKVAACHAARDAGADFVKTSTGFGGGGATIADVSLMRASSPADVQVKASGGVRDLPTALAMVAVGATRLGTSSSVGLVEAARAAAASGAGLVVPDPADVSGLAAVDTY